MDFFRILRAAEGGELRIVRILLAAALSAELLDLPRERCRQRSRRFELSRSLLSQVIQSALKSRDVVLERCAGRRRLLRVVLEQRHALARLLSFRGLLLQLILRLLKSSSLIELGSPRGRGCRRRERSPWLREPSLKRHDCWLRLELSDVPCASTSSCSSSRSTSARTIEVRDLARLEGSQVQREIDV